MTGNGQKHTLADMLKIIFNRWVVGIAVFLVVRMALGEIFDLTVYCSDGWKSPSIGKSGACSYHGGVDAGAVGLANLTSVVLGIVAGLGTGFIQENEIHIPSRTTSYENDNKLKTQIKTEKTSKSAHEFIGRSSYALNTKLSILSRENKIEVFGDCMKCGVRFRWSGLTIEMELQEYKQMTVNEIRGKVKCPDCSSALQFGYLEIKSELSDGFKTQH